MSLNVSGYNISDIYVGDDKIDKIFVGEDLVYTSGGAGLSQPLCVTAVNNSVGSGVAFSMSEASMFLGPGKLLEFNANNYPDYVAPTLVYSYDMQNWNAYTLGNYVYIGGNNPNSVYFKNSTNNRLW